MGINTHKFRHGDIVKLSSIRTHILYEFCWKYALYCYSRYYRYTYFKSSYNIFYNYQGIVSQQKRNQDIMHILQWQVNKSISSNNKVMNVFPTQGIVCQQKIGFPYFLNFLRYLLCKEKLVQEKRTESNFDVYIIVIFIQI